MADKVRVGCIGTGWWATEAHMPGLLSHEGAVLTAICDPDPARLATAARAFGVERRYADHAEMLAREDLDGVVIATPHATHYPLARACLERGLHILLEKPMTLRAAHAKTLVDLAAERGVHIVIGYNYNYAPQNRRAREVVQGGELGAVEYVICSFSSDMTRFLGGGVSDDNAPIRYTVQGPSAAYNSPELLGGGHGHLQLTHAAGMLFFVTGLRVARVQALMRNQGRAVDMVNAMSVGFEGEAVGIVGGTGNAGNSHQVALTVYCREGCFQADSLSRTAMIRRKDGATEDLTALPHPWNRYVVTHNFVDTILGRAENGSPGEVGWRTVELLDAAYRSAAQDGAGVRVSDLYTSEA